MGVGSLVLSWELAPAASTRRLNCLRQDLDRLDLGLQKCSRSFGKGFAPGRKKMLRNVVDQVHGFRARDGAGVSLVRVLSQQTTEAFDGE